MNWKLVLRGSAAKDVLEVFFWYHTIRPELGDRFMAALRESYDSIQTNPYGYHVRKGNFRHVLLRKFPYRVVYEVEGEDVFIYRVIHTSRKPGKRYGPLGFSGTWAACPNRLFLPHETPAAMDIALKKLDLMQRLMLIWDEAALRRVAKVIEKESPSVVEDEDITDEEYAAFQEELAKCERGELKFHTREESMRMIREGSKE